jgi:hypothetical protein
MSSLWAPLAQTDPDVAKELADQFSEVLIPILLGTIFLVVVLVGGLMLYFRRGDRAVNARLREARAASVRFPGQDEEIPSSAEPAPADETRGDTPPPA